MKTALTRDDIAHMLQTNQEWLERGVLAIHARQTDAEQRSNTTREHNGRGWSGYDASYMSYVANYIESTHNKGAAYGACLSGKHIDKVRRRMTRYTGQLERIALEKAGAGR